MSSRCAAVCALVIALAVPAVTQAEPSKPSGTLTLSRALQRAVAANPKLAVADRDIGIAAGKRLQAGAIPNPEISFELDNAFGTGQFRGLDSAETTLAAQPGDRARRQARCAHRGGLGRARGRALGARRRAARDSVRYRGGVLQRARRAAQDPDLRRADRVARPAYADIAAAGRSRRVLAGGDRARPPRRRSRARGTRTRPHGARHRPARACDPHGFQCRGLSHMWSGI